jgi:hypothetical protein
MSLPIVAMPPETAPTESAKSTVATFQDITSKPISPQKVQEEAGVPPTMRQSESDDDCKFFSLSRHAVDFTNSVLAYDLEIIDPEADEKQKLLAAAPSTPRGRAEQQSQMTQKR